MKPELSEYSDKELRTELRKRAEARALPPEFEWRKTYGATGSDLWEVGDDRGAPNPHGGQVIDWSRCFPWWAFSGGAEVKGEAETLKEAQRLVENWLRSHAPHRKDTGTDL